MCWILQIVDNTFCNDLRPVVSFQHAAKTVRLRITALDFINSAQISYVVYKNLASQGRLIIFKFWYYINIFGPPSLLKLKFWTCFCYFSNILESRSIVFFCKQRGSVIPQIYWKNQLPDSRENGNKVQLHQLQDKMLNI